MRKKLFAWKRSLLIVRSEQKIIWDSGGFPGTTFGVSGSKERGLCPVCLYWDVKVPKPGGIIWGGTSLLHGKKNLPEELFFGVLSCRRNLYRGEDGFPREAKL